MRQCITIKCGGALLAGALALSLLAGCAADTSAPVVTEDDLTPSSAAQEILEQDYTYFWFGESLDNDPERAEQLVWNYLQDDAQHLRELLQTEPLIDEDREIIETQLKYIESEQTLNEKIEEMHKRVQEQQGFDPVISPQEAANRAGLLFEKVYGLDLTGTEVYVNCYQYTANGDYIPYGGQMIWTALALDGPLASIDPSAQRRASCILDATTGELIEASYRFAEEELAAMQNTPVHEAYLPGAYQWDTQHPGYAGAVDAVQQQLAQAFSGSMLADGAAVTGAEQIKDRYTVLAYRFGCDNGKTYNLLRSTEVDPYTQYDFGGYPLRACYFENEAYFQ